jgi:hypothetical protein
MVIQAAKLFRQLVNYRNITACLRRIGIDEKMDDGKWDPYLQAAVLEIVALVCRNNLRVARESARAVEPYWLDVQTQEDFFLLFDIE